VISVGDCVLPLDGNIAAPRLLVVRIASTAKTTSCHENKTINVYCNSTYLHNEIQMSGSVDLIIQKLNVESLSSWVDLAEEHQILFFL
jgi:hypothetical protein